MRFPTISKYFLIENQDLKSVPFEMLYENLDCRLYFVKKKIKTFFKCVDWAGQSTSSRYATLSKRWSKIGNFIQVRKKEHECNESYRLVDPLIQSVVAFFSLNRHVDYDNWIINSNWTNNLHNFSFYIFTYPLVLHRLNTNVGSRYPSEDRSLCGALISYRWKKILINDLKEDEYDHEKKKETVYRTYFIVAIYSGEKRWWRRKVVALCILYSVYVLLMEQETETTIKWVNILIQTTRRRFDITVILCWPRYTILRTK